MMNQTIHNLINEQLTSWETARNNYEALSTVKVKELDVNGVPYKVQFNPARIVSSGAKVDAKTIKERKCFLCPANLPAVQKGVSFKEHYNILVNPFPIFPRHLTIPEQAHVDQRIASRMEDMLDLAQALTDYVIFYNGPKCGASAPDHFHLQGVLKKDVPLIIQYPQLKEGSQLLQQEEKFEESDKYGFFSYYEQNFYYIDKYLCPLFAFETNSPQANIDLKQILRFFPKDKDENEPKFNIFVWRENNKQIILLIPRSKHRPDCFFATGDNQRLISPGALDMAGILVTTRPEDFEQMNADEILNIICEVGLSFKEAEAIANKYKR